MTRKTSKISLNLPDAILRGIDEYAEKENLSFRTETILKLLKFGLEANNIDLSERERTVEIQEEYVDKILCPVTNKFGQYERCQKNLRASNPQCKGCSAIPQSWLRDFKQELEEAKAIEEEHTRVSEALTKMAKSSEEKEAITTEETELEESEITPTEELTPQAEEVTPTEEPITEERELENFTATENGIKHIEKPVTEEIEEKNHETTTKKLSPPFAGFTYCPLKSKEKPTQISLAECEKTCRTQEERRACKEHKKVGN